ncbi:Retrotransposon-derived protein PEG10 [Smittium culicis]|uniref:Retrotransposon-derived protein PEG10 n=1 Tax=Smittium culicis TaxID=133412 RepID=A0A1R1YPF7_9FUNG|nr:Retrotransposon-derived protein PEG10 [Smittium culicis]
MSPKLRPFPTENTPVTNIEATKNMDQAPETTIGPEQEYIEAQIRPQVQSKSGYLRGGQKQNIVHRNTPFRNCFNLFTIFFSIKFTLPGRFRIFLNEFRNNFFDPNHSIKARSQIRNCKQGSRSASFYDSEFRTLSRESGFDKVALVDQFLRGLNHKIVQYLIVMDISESLEENIQLTVRIDNLLCAMNFISENKSDGPSLNPFRSKKNPSLSSVTTSNSQNQESTVYMEIDAMTSRPRGPLSEKEKEKFRRYELGLCLYCGSSGYIALDCTKRKFPGKVRTQL